MALRIKLARGGSAHNPVYRIVVGEARAKRDGKFVEWIGTYSPKAARGQLKIQLDRADYWVGVGATPTDTVRSLINKARREPAEEGLPASAVEKTLEPATEEVAVPVVEEVPVAEESSPVAEESAPVAEESAPVEAEAVADEAPAVEESPEKVAETAVEEETPATEETDEEKKDA